MEQKDTKIVLESPLLLHDREEKMSKNWFDVSETTEELKKQGFLAGPLVVVSFLQYSLQLISVMFVGHLGELSLASASMASSFAGVTGFSVMLGMGGALETLCGQAYGAKQYNMLGIHMQRALFVLMITCIPIAFLWQFTGQIFISCGQDRDISVYAGTYARWLIPSLFPYGILQCQFRFLQTQEVLKPLIISTFFTSLMHILTCWMLVFLFGFGHKGAAISNAISYGINVLILAAYIKFSPSCEKTWTGFSKESFQNLWSFVSLAIPSALMVCMEQWSYEFLVLMSGLLPNPKLETSMISISLATSSLVYRIPYGFGSAVSTRVSNELGAAKPQSAKVAARMVLFLAVIEGLLVGIVSLAVRDAWGYLYTGEGEVIKYMAAIMPVLVLSNFMDGIQGVLSGVARGCGWQKIGAFVNLGAYYLVGLPASIILTFVFHFGGKGLWMGIIGGSGLQAFLLLAITMRTNWEQEAIKSRERLLSSSMLSTSQSGDIDFFP